MEHDQEDMAMAMHIAAVVRVYADSAGALSLDYVDDRFKFGCEFECGKLSDLHCPESEVSTRSAVSGTTSNTRFNDSALPDCAQPTTNTPATTSPTTTTPTRTSTATDEAATTRNATTTPTTTSPTTKSPTTISPTRTCNVDTDFFSFDTGTTATCGS